MQLLVTNLPEYYDGCYTEKDLANLLMPFGFQYADDSIVVVPQACMVGTGSFLYMYCYVIYIGTPTKTHDTDLNRIEKCEMVLKKCLDQVNTSSNTSVFFPLRHLS